MESNCRYVLLLRSSNANDEYESQITRGCNVWSVSIPVLDFAYKNVDLLAAMLVEVNKYAGLIFTSPRAVEAFSKALSSIDLNGNMNLLSSIERTEFFVVGKATEKALMKIRRQLDIELQCDGSKEGSAENLAHYITNLKNVRNETRPFLFLCGNIARECIPNILSSHDIHVVSTCVYETLPDPKFKENLTNLLSSRSEPTIIVFFSPSGIEFSLHVLQDAIPVFDKVKLIAIGHTTANAFHGKGCKVHGIPEKPTAEHLSLCIKSVLSDLAYNNG